MHPTLICIACCTLDGLAEEGPFSLCASGGICNDDPCDEHLYTLFFETESCCVSQAILNLRSSSLSLPRAGITGLCYHTWPFFYTLYKAEHHLPLAHSMPTVNLCGSLIIIKGHNNYSHFTGKESVALRKDLPQDCFTHTWPFQFSSPVHWTGRTVLFLLHHLV
jgi:hypothetical protein